MNDAAQVDPEVYIHVLGQDRRLQYNFWTDIQFKRLTKGERSILKGFHGTDPEEVIFALWVGLVEHSPDLKGRISSDGKPDRDAEVHLARLAKDIPLTRYPEITRKINEALNLFFGDAEEGEEKEEESSEETKKKDGTTESK